MKGFVKWNPAYSRKDFRLERGSNPGRWISRPALNLLSYRGTKVDQKKTVAISQMFSYVQLHVH